MQKLSGIFSLDKVKVLGKNFSVIKQTIIEWIVGILVLVSGMGILGVVLYFIGKKQGEW